MASPVETEEIIKKSRFITRVYPVEDEGEIERILKENRKEHYKATHVCSAWVLNTKPERMKASDDGEPSGTAGRPILDVILNREIKNVLVVVIRYFGGIKLGAGGLVRAYSGGAAAALSKAPLVREEKIRRVEVQTEYSFYQGLLNDLKEAGLTPAEEAFSDVVALIFEIPDGLEEKFEARVRDFTNDNYILSVEAPTFMKRPYMGETISL